VELLVGVADALATAHDAGFLHRDVKPANILVARNGYAKLADFGLAKLADAPDQETRTEPRTGAGVVVGTLDYMSPEQLTGGAIDQRSDVFSFGIVLYEALAGRRPFAGETSMHVVEGIMHAAPPPLTGDQPAPLREVVAKALEKDRADRYQSMRELVVDLRRLVRTSAEVAVPASSNRLRRWPVAAALLALAAAATGAAAWWRSVPASSSGGRPPIHSIAVLPLENLSGDPGQDYFSDGMTEELITRLAQVRALRVISRQSVMRFKHSGESMPEIGRALGVDAILGGSVRRADGRVRVAAQLIHASTDAHLWADDFDGDVENVFKLQANIAQAIVREVRVQVQPQEASQLAALPAVSGAAHEMYALGRHQLARSDAEGSDKAIGYFEQAIKLQPDYAAAYAGVSWGWQTKRSLGFSSEEGALHSAAERAIQLDPNLAEAQAAYAGARFEVWDWTGSVAAYEKALALNPTSVDCGCYSYVLSALGRHDRALEVSQAILTINPLSVDAQQEHGFVLLMMRRYAEAEQHALRALELEPRSVIGSVVLTFSYALRGQWDKAEKAASRPELRNSSVMGRVYAAAGRRAEAEALLRKLPPSDIFGIATVELALGNRDRGFAALGKAVDQKVGVARWLKVDPHFDEFRGDRRFQAIVARMKLPE
jgi:TolB-like protein/tetratricopeptide (TPR) repeat protein